MKYSTCTKRIQPARGWCATVGGTANCIHLPRLSGGPATHFFFGSQPCVPAAWLAERLLLAGDIESNPGTAYLTLGCLPREWCLCWSGGRDAWQGFSREIGLSDPSTATHSRGRSTTSIAHTSVFRQGTGCTEGVLYHRWLTFEF